MSNTVATNTCGSWAMKWSSSKLRCPLNIKYVPDIKDLVRIKECKISYQSLFILITYWDDNVFNIFGKIKYVIKTNFTIWFFYFFMCLLKHFKIISVARVCGYHNVSTQQCCSGDNVVLVLKTFKPKQQTQANLLEVQILWTSSKLMKELKSS